MTRARRGPDQLAFDLAPPAPPAELPAESRTAGPGALRDWLAGWLAALPRTLDRRAIVLVPTAALAHDLRRHVAVQCRRPGDLLGVAMMRPAAVAAELLARSGQPVAPGQEPMRWLILRELFSRRAFAGALHYFAAEALAGGRGYADAFARTIADLEAAGLGPADLVRAAAALAPGEPDAADRLRDVATVWRALAGEEDECRRTRSQLLSDATALLADRPELGRGLGARSEERRVGKECNGQCRSRWSPYH